MTFFHPLIAIVTSSRTLASDDCNLTARYIDIKILEAVVAQLFCPRVSLAFELRAEMMMLKP